jgi:DNA-binding response OmpR family regulator
MKKIVAIENVTHTLSKIYFIADVKKHQVITLNDFSEAIYTLKKELPDILIINCDLYKGNLNNFIEEARLQLPELYIIGCSWRTAKTAKGRATPLALDAFIKMPMDVRKVSLALEAIEYGYTLFPAEILSHG